MARELVYWSDLGRCTSKALMLVEGSVAKCENSEAEIAVDRAVVGNPARRGQRLNLRLGYAVYDKGDAAMLLLIVISGNVKLVARDRNLPNLFFGEICLHGEDLEDSESAKSFSYQDLRILASKAEHACFEIDEPIVEVGVFQVNSTTRAGGLLLLGYGKPLLVGSRTELTGDAAMLPKLRSPSQPIVASGTIPIDPTGQNKARHSQIAMTSAAGADDDESHL
ncbi:hypothetical protein PybrP1_010570 [[Pythium] brassicae (nom. inval.)]|nr:hypothetical protein PybrP1_010570 [[Pythium] brassicae (nom. inval.)]